MLELGEVVEKPKQVFGGLLHKSFDVATSKGHYFIKALNPQIMLRPTAMKNHLFADEVSIIAVNTGLSASAVKKIEGKTIHSIDGQYYQVFDWLDGLSYTHRPENLVECYKVGVLLGQLHQIDFLSIENPDIKDGKRSKIDWQGILDQANNSDTLKRLEDIDINYIDLAETESLKALELLERQVISHRDLDPKNVMWGVDGKPIIIDWEAAGYVNPTFELVEVAVYWSECKDCTINIDAFLEVLKGYHSVCPIHFNDLQYVWRALNINMIGWIEYNLKRSIGIEVNSRDECDLGYQQVIDTIKSMKMLDEQIELLKASVLTLR
ncbi:phosphotransferase enzyme family protein [Vallitalea guaymasensis]|uniref:Phosphotransferase n=1 Tax=Vallitalea guaymasensis TaxID=1185412 RepID=A0A8J8M9A4_9FIRM|nr:phosphotransferase [Vallitalea guaymasensis]QUH28573.1 phosphotransferase [Vallitalea guaymasensis]